MVSPPFDGGVALVEIWRTQLAAWRRPLPQPLEILGPLLPGRVGPVVDRDRQRHRVLRVVAKISVGEPQESLFRRARRSQQQQRQRDLHRHQDTMHASSLRAADDAPRARLCDTPEIRTR
jgi:hypothetical protein